MKKSLSILLSALMLMGIMLSFTACTDDDPAASLDYGDNYYYDSGTGKVERSFQGILNDAPEWDD